VGRPMAGPAGAPPKVGDRSPLPTASRPGGWTPPGASGGQTPLGDRRGWSPPGANEIGTPFPGINRPTDITNPKDFPASDLRRGVNDLADASKASGVDPLGRRELPKDASAAAEAFDRRELAEKASAAADNISQRDLSQGASSAADAARELYDREYARDLFDRWSWWSYGGGGGYSSDGGYGTSDGGYYSNPYSTEGTTGYGSTPDAASQEQAKAAQTEESGSMDSTNAEDDSAAVKRCMDVALRDFHTGDYPAAQKQCEKALQLQPNDVNLREFRALCQFSQGNYKDAAATLHGVLVGGPGWSWKTLISLYTNAEIYTKQLRTLEQRVRDNPSDAASHFVLGYHYLALDARDAALNQLQQVAKLQPQDKVSVGIVRALVAANKNNGGQSAEKPMPGR
jgi:tetratricopeptide (TPR) repeat protein